MQNFSHICIVYMFMKGCKIEIGCVAVVLLLLIFTSCRKEERKIGVAQASDGAWCQTMNNEIRRAILTHPGLSVEIRTADTVTARQIDDIRYFIDNDFDVIVVAPTSRTGVIPVVREAYRKGIHVIMLDPMISSDCYTTWIHGDSYDVGRRAAEYALAKYSAAGPPKAIEIMGPAWTEPAILRHKAFGEILTKGGGRLLASASGDWGEASSARLVDSLMRIYPETEVVFAHNDFMAIGASKALRRLGRGDVRVMGVDADPNTGMPAVRDGVIDATFLNPTAGYEIVETAAALIDGKKVDRQISFPISSAVDKSNVDILLSQNRALEEDAEAVQTLKSTLDTYLETRQLLNVILYAALAIGLLLIGLSVMAVKYASARRRHAAVLEEKNRELEQSAMAKLSFYANVSNDLRTPLSLVSGPISKFAEADNLTPEQRQMAVTARKNVDILERLINQIGDNRRYGDGRLSVPRQDAEEDNAAAAAEGGEEDNDAADAEGAEIMIAGSPEAFEGNGPDRDFYARFLDALGKRIADSDLTIDDIAADLGLGHSQFYRKIKALTGYTPVELVRLIRLERTRSQLLTTDMSVSEIAYANGFSAPNYFTKCFRELYKETPSELRSRLNPGSDRS